MYCSELDRCAFTWSQVNNDDYENAYSYRVIY